MSLFKEWGVMVLRYSFLAIVCIGVSTVFIPLPLGRGGCEKTATIFKDLVLFVLLIDTRKKLYKHNFFKNKKSLLFNHYLKSGFKKFFFCYSKIILLLRRIKEKIKFVLISKIYSSSFKVFEKKLFRFKLNVYS